MKKFEFTQDYDKNKKGDIVEFDLENYHQRTHPLLMRGILKQIKAISSNRYSELKSLNKIEQVKLIKGFDENAVIPSTEDGRIKLIMQLEGN